MRTWIDHLVVACADLSVGTAKVAAVLGQEPPYGGAHEGLGTHNALASLGDETYLEIIAPDPSQPKPDGPLPFGADSLDPELDAKLTAFAVGTDDLPALIAAVRQAGFDITDPVDGKRRREDGSLITWQLAFCGQPGLTTVGGPTPFFISWGATTSPATTNSRIGTFVSLAATDPEPSHHQPLLDLLAASSLPPIMIGEGKATTLAATITGTGPSGTTTVTLSELT